MHPFLENLAHSEKRTELYLNKKKEGKIRNRLRKFLHAPYRYPYHLAYKAGLIRRDDVRVQTFFYRKIVVPLWDDNIVVLYYCGSLGPAECRLSKFFIKNLKEIDVFYDIGANFGFYTYVAEALRCKEVHTFEPNETVLRYIRKNILQTSVLNELALADTAGELEFHDIAASHKSGMSSLFEDVLTERAKEGQRVTRVPTITLDEYVATHTPPTVIKLDVENSEALVLRGGRKFLTEASPIITMEAWDAPRARVRTEEALTLMKEFGYTSHELLPDGEIREAPVVLGSLGEFNTFIFKK